MYMPRRHFDSESALFRTHVFSTCQNFVPSKGYHCGYSNMIVSPSPPSGSASPFQLNHYSPSLDSLSIILSSLCIYTFYLPPLLTSSFSFSPKTSHGILFPSLCPPVLCGKVPLAERLPNCPTWRQQLRRYLAPRHLQAVPR